MDVATPQLWTETVFGLTSGWWRFTDRDLRLGAPVAGPFAMGGVAAGSRLQRDGFVARLDGPARRRANRHSRAQAVAVGRSCRQRWSETPAEKSWLIFADDGGNRSVVRRAVARNRCSLPNGAPWNCISPWRTRYLYPEGRRTGRLDELFAACTDDAAPERIVYLWNLDTQIDEPGMGTDALLHLAQVLESTRPNARIRIDSITRGAQPVGRDVKPTRVEQAPAIGLARVILNEYTNLVCRGIDLPPAPSDADIALLWTELLRSDPRA